MKKFLQQKNKQIIFTQIVAIYFLINLIINLIN